MASKSGRPAAHHLRRHHLELGVGAARPQADRAEQGLLERGLGRHRHVHAGMLDRLVHADRPAELHAVLGVLDGQVGDRLGDAYEDGRRESETAQPQRLHLRRRPARHGRAVGSRGGQPGPRVDAVDGLDVADHGRLHQASA